MVTSPIKRKDKADTLRFIEQDAVNDKTADAVFPVVAHTTFRVRYYFGGVAQVSECI